MEALARKMHEASTLKSLAPRETTLARTILVYAHTAQKFLVQLRLAGEGGVCLLLVVRSFGWGA
jgi:hypothetical protein